MAIPKPLYELATWLRDDAADPVFVLYEAGRVIVRPRSWYKELRTRLDDAKALEAIGIILKMGGVTVKKTSVQLTVPSDVIWFLFGPMAFGLLHSGTEEADEGSIGSRVEDTDSAIGFFVLAAFGGSHPFLELWTHEYAVGRFQKESRAFERALRLPEGPE